MKLSDFIMDPIKEDMGNTKQGLNIDKLLKCGEGLERADAFGKNCIRSGEKYLMWGFRAKNSGFTDNIDKFLDNSENSEDNLTYAQVSKTSGGYCFRTVSAMEYRKLRNNRNAKNVELKDDNSRRCPKEEDKFYTEAEMYQALANLLKE